MFDFLETESSYYVKRECLKTQYMVLVKYESLRNIYVNDKDHLIMIMKEVINPKKGIQYEAFLLLSLFILMPRSDERVSNLLKKNQRHLIEFIEKF